MKNELIERLTTYVKIDTQSDETTGTTPSTPGQLELARTLVDELKAIGMKDVSIDENGYVMATLPSNTEKRVPTIGFLAHVDTATDFTGTNVNPQIIETYTGGDIVLNEGLNRVLSAKTFPNLENYKGHTLITTDGTTLLGADNKAGIAEIMTAMAYLIQHPEIKHGQIRVAFTPDEEIGLGPHKFDVDAFNAAFAYTMDGGPIGELEYESFNAADAKITFHGENVHPGTAKDKMINATKMAIDFNAKLPVEEAPESTEKYAGFFHLVDMSGEVGKATLHYIIRDFDKAAFQERKTKIEKIADELRKEYGEDRIHVTLRDQYYNMREKIEPVMEIVDVAREVMESLDIEPIIEPIRGGTDGSQLSYMGLPTPNIFTGGENYHGPYEFISVDNMVKAVHVILGIVERFEQRSEN